MTTITSGRGLIVATLALLCLTPPAFAQTTADWEQLDQLMAEGLSASEKWRRGWTAFFAGSATLNLYLGTSAEEPDERFDGRVKAITSTLGLIDTLIKMPPHTQAYRDYHALDRDEPGSLDKARSVATDLARAERRRTGWRGRIGSLIVNGGAYAAIENDGRPNDALQAALTGLLVNEIKLWTATRTFSESKAISIGNASVPVETNVYATTTGIGFSMRF